MSTNEMSPALEQAFQLFQQSDLIGAENVLITAVENAKSIHGETSAEFAGANYELGSLLTIMGRLPDAASALRLACNVSIPDDTNVTRDRLTYMMQLGELYQQMGELEEAEKILRHGLELRADFYGKDHAGYGFGLEPLAEVMLHQGNLSAALEMTDQTIDNFWMNGHPRVATAFPLRAVILKKLGDEASTFDELDELADEILVQMVDHALEIADPDDPTVGQSMLHDLLRLIHRRLGEQHAATIKLQTGMVNLSHKLGPSEGRIETIERVIAAHLANGQEEDAVNGMLGLAMAQGEIGDATACEQTYKQAFKKAKSLGDFALQAQCLRNLGLYLSESERIQEAEETLRLAAKAAKQSNDDEMFGRCMVALGIFLQHNGQLNDAQRYLTEAMKTLDPSHPDSVCGRSHLSAIENNLSCGCGDMSSALCQAFQQHLLAAIPDGFVNEVSVIMGESGMEVALDFARELSESEQDVLQRTLQQAHIDFRKRLEENG